VRTVCLGLIAALLPACTTLEEELRFHRQAHAKSSDPSYLIGFSEGCESAYAQSHIVIKAQYRRDESRMRRDGRYASGWDDGRAACNYPDSRTTFLLKRRGG
jgi:hypothetical protein